MLSEQLKELENAKALVAEIQQRIAEERKLALISLPAQFGFTSIDELISALRAVTESGTHKRTRITDEVRANIRKLIQEGKTGDEIAVTTKISRATIQSIKKEMGLVKARK